MILDPTQKRGVVASELRSHETSTQSSLSSHFLHVGEVHVSVRPQSIVLILGSCVAVCAWDPGTGIGGATHYLLPSWDGKGAPSARYGNVAITTLLQRLADAGARHDQLYAKVFGGGRLFETTPNSSTNKTDLGARNIEIAAEILLKERIPNDASLVGGNRGKRILFHTSTGQTSVSHL